MVQKILGIMTNRLTEPKKFKSYRDVALAEGFDEVVIFTPSNLDLNRKKVNGYVYQEGKFVKKELPYPIISHDIGYYSDPQTNRYVRKIKNEKSLPFTGYGLGNKWNIHQHLKQFSEILPHLIPTEPAKTLSVQRMLEQHDTLILKPINGKEGKGIVRLQLTDQGFCLQENDSPDRHFSQGQLPIVLNQLEKSQKYLAQKWIDIRNRSGHVYDIRSLMQKDGAGQWRLVGMSVREGGKGRHTSNLMDGGSPYPVDQYLRKEFGKRTTKQLKAQLEELSFRICHCIEQAYQKRQVELGLDLAIDRDKKIWVIEVNIKPGKIPFGDTFPFKSVEDGLRLPIQYAHYLAR